MTCQSILIVDDDPAVHEVVRQALSCEGYAVFGAATGVEGLQIWKRHDPQLIILDLVMPHLSGLQILEQIRQKDETPVVMLTRKSCATDMVRAFELGADDCLSKPFSSRELTMRVKAVLRRVHGSLPPTSPTAVQTGKLHLELEARHATIGERLVVLSRLECQILAELARAPGRILSHAQLLTAVWGPEYADEAQLLRCAIYRLRQKLEPDPARPTYLRAARDAGYWLATANEAAA